MKTIVDFLRENEVYYAEIGDCEIKFELHKNDLITMRVNRFDEVESYKIEDDHESNIMDILSDDYDTEVRFCSECGVPYDIGYIAGDGDWYCCEDCFDNAMNDEYGEGNWRATAVEGKHGGFYEAIVNGEWEDTGIYYTEWN